ncbi:hypothetical protein COHA_005448 [Chlorella ohadii]|uniref:Uncharacterized protein n=1 Tax=Chlorella ohadii TaxID=2649997 RepID=A0AAD5DRB8_9CHLO|nr:hypothetical protein COHA_005448 [Chlorella ohadii]
MGQRVSQPDQEDERLQELSVLLSQAYNLQRRCDQAVYAAVAAHVAELRAEERAITARIVARMDGRCLPMPDPTPPLCLPPVPGPEAAATQAVQSADKREPGTPAGVIDMHHRQRGESSSSEEGAHAAGAQCSEDAPLLAATAGTQALGLRRRQAHAEGSRAFSST